MLTTRVCYSPARRIASRLLGGSALLLSISCQPPSTPPDAAAFVKRAEERLDELADRAQRANWVQANFVTQDTERLAADGLSTLLAWTGRAGRQTALYEGQDLAPDVARKLTLIKLALPLAAPNDTEKREELAAVSFEMESIYATGEYCPEGRDCLDLGQLSRVLAEKVVARLAGLSPPARRARRAGRRTRPRPGPRPRPALPGGGIRVGPPGADRGPGAPLTAPGPAERVLRPDDFGGWTVRVGE